MKKFKSHVCLLLVILSCQGLLQAEGSQNCDCAVPTQYVMQFLAKSGTKWQGNEEWVKDLTKGARVETNYLYIHDTLTGNSQKYTGAAVAAHDIYSFTGKAPVDTVKAKFIITKDSNGSAIIISSIETIEVRKVTDLREIETLKSRIKEANGKAETQTDYCSACHYKTTVEFDDATNTLRAMLISPCETKMPFDLFIKELEKHRNGFK